MADFLLNPEEFQSQVDTFKSATGTVSGLSYQAEKGGLKLQSVDKYKECVKAMNE